MSGVVEFLLARYAEDEADADNVHDIAECSALEWGGMTTKECDCGWPARVLSGIEAKRRFISQNANANPNGDDWAQVAWDALLAFAAEFADHPDHQQEWLP